MCDKVGHYVRNCQYKKKIVEGNVVTWNDQESTPNKKKCDVETLFVITKLDEKHSEIQVELTMYFNELD